MTHQAQEADANLAEIRRLRTRIGHLLDDVEQMRREIAAERRARELAEADAAAYRRIIDVLSRAGDFASLRGVASAALVKFQPGAALLAELEAARELKEWARKWQRDHIVSLEMIRAMDAMDAARKAGDE